MRKKLLFLALALTASAAALATRPAQAIGCGWVCTAPHCCVYCCYNQPCPPPACEP